MSHLCAHGERAAPISVVGDWMGDTILLHLVELGFKLRLEGECCICEVGKYAVALSIRWRHVLGLKLPCVKLVEV